MNRPEEITKEYLHALDEHLNEIVLGNKDTYPEIRDFANYLNIHPTHLSNTIKEVTGKSPCEWCHYKTIEIAKSLLKNPKLSIAEIAKNLTYEHSNFTKYFKLKTGMTPSVFRKSISLK